MVCQRYATIAPLCDEVKKDMIIVDLYKTGCLDGLYFGQPNRSHSNPVKRYIETRLSKCGIDHRNTDSLVEDCYNEAFSYLVQMPVDKFITMYKTDPRSILAALLRTISLKCFARDPRNYRPKHSLVPYVMFASSYSYTSDSLTVNASLDQSNQTQAGAEEVNSWSHREFADESGICTFTEQYGFSPEDIINLLPNDLKDEFYSILGKQPRGKLPQHRIELRARLTQTLLSIKQSLSR